MSDAPAVAAGELMDALFLTMRRIRREGIHASSMSYADLMILGYLRKSPGLGVSDLATEAGVSGPTMSAQIKRLEASGLVQRDPGPDTDRRRVSLKLSPEAETMIDQLKQRGVDWMAERLSELSAEDRARLAAAIPALLILAAPPPKDSDVENSAVKFQ